MTTAALAPTTIRRRPFGRKAPVSAPAAVPATAGPGDLTDDLKLFFVNFLGGLVFMTVYLA